MNADSIPQWSCPACRSRYVCKAQHEGLLEHTLLRLVEIGPFICDSCQLRFYMFLAPVKSRRRELIHADETL